MRILHTSDWHLGQHFMGKTRQAEHQAFCAWLLEQVRSHAVDVLLIAGDVFDTGAPPSYAREQYYRLVVELRDAGCALVVLGGNHDSPAMLGESRSLLAQLGTQVVPGVGVDLAEQVRVLHDREGVPGAILCAVPFIRPRDVTASQAGQSAQDKQQSLQQAIAEHYRALHELAQRKRDELGLGLPIIATGHLTTVGASASESVREIYVGSLEAFPTSAFPPADYIALGHIHRPQKVGGLEHIRYSGSPIALSFDEARQQKEVLLLTFGDGSLQSITPLPVPVFQPMASLRGSLKELAGAIAEQAAQGTPERPVWLEVQVSSDDYLSDLQSRINALCEGLPVEVLRIRRERGAASASLASEARETLDELSVEDVFSRRLQQETLDEDDSQRLQDLYRQVLETLPRA
ncbi:exonuclease subunit SbcD [Ectopseudomonas hydrolytica]|uniref:Nuclease SbcCD subunit D n=1 Tax=Ectopseudomonas hydrolytica TaxID=2493633 RepID=A0ABY5AD37_9GAMM|nr:MULTISPECIES: exonuclease subunit SbcD [Pseudomonas]MDH0097584.1 exonuclease subunit SbcD [Pseudomonas sp. GD04158]USR40924.1 exonuclease subunit SbcD [Pseudomonas hydrolytica]